MHRANLLAAGHALNLDVAPGRVDVDADEEISSAVAAILAIVAFELARIGRNGLAQFADQLDRALEIGRFGIELEHVFHASDMFAIDLGKALPIPTPRLEAVLGQPPAYGLA